jgi:hypothetical protein
VTAPSALRHINLWRSPSSVWLWVIATGVLSITEAIRLRKEISGDVRPALSGRRDDDTIRLVDRIMTSRRLVQAGTADRYFF